MLCVLPMKRGQLEVAGVRLTDPPSSSKLLFAFTTPLSLVNSMARIHVRLLGPCFKTGRRDHQPHRDRYAALVRTQLPERRPLKSRHSVAWDRSTMRLRGSSRLGRPMPAFTFIAPTGFPPQDSHACCTPWSVFQDGSDAAI